MEWNRINEIKEEFYIIILRESNRIEIMAEGVR